MTERDFMKSNGLKKSSAHVCVRWLALGRCGSNPMRETLPGCSMFGCVFDHASIYLHDGKPACIVGHEYPQGEERLREWLGYLDEWPQLGLLVNGDSWHHSTTFMVVLYNRDVWKEAP